MFGFFLIGIVPVLTISSQETFELTAYNLLNYSLENDIPNREIELKGIQSNTQPDLFLNYKKKYYANQCFFRC